MIVHAVEVNCRAALSSGPPGARSQRARVTVARTISRCRAGVLVKLPVTLQSGIKITNEFRDLTFSDRPIVNPHFVYASLEVMRDELHLPAANSQIILAGVHISYRTGAIVGMHQAGVSVGPDRAVVVSDRDMRPLIE